MYQTSRGEWRLTTSERKRILLANVYGVDLDYQAVEVTKLSLLLKVLEGETEQSLDQQRKLFHKDRALPDLAANIKCGNSLIGPDFYNGHQLSLLDEDERLRINVFDWQGGHGFPEIMHGGGFDAVIGNPPYLFITEVPADMRGYYERRYQSIAYRFDLYGTFIEKSARELLRSRGLFGFIIPHTLLSNDSFARLRAMLASETQLSKIIDLGPGVFKNAKNETMLLFFRREPPAQDHAVEVARSSPRAWPQAIESFSVQQDLWAKPDGSPWLVHVNGEQGALLAHMDAAGHTLAEFCTANQGVRTGDNERYLAAESRGKKWRRAAGGKQIGRYEPIPDELYVYYDQALLDAPRNPALFLTPEKVLVQEIRKISLPRRIVATLDTEQVFGLQSTNVINVIAGCELSIRYLLGLLNSNPVNVYFRYRFPGNNHIPSNQLLRIPIPIPAQRREHDQMAGLVQQMLDLRRRRTQVRIAHEKAALDRQSEIVDRQIDEIACRLYGLSSEQIRLIEAASR